MAELERPIKHALRDPELPVDAMWQTIRARTDRQRANWPNRFRQSDAVRTPAFAAAISGVFALAVLGVMVLAPKLDRRHADVPLRRADGELLGVLDAAKRGAAVDVALSDGSNIRLEAGAKLVAQKSDARQVRVSVVRGRVWFDVRPRGPRRWTIDAGDTQVEVIGTRFSVQHDAGRVTVSVEQGRVGVRGPRVPHRYQSLGQGEGLEIGPPPSAADARVPAPASPRREPPPAPSPPAARNAPTAASRATVDALLER